MALNIKQLKEKIEEEANDANCYALGAQFITDREYFLGKRDGLYHAITILQEVIDEEEEKQRKQQDALNTIKEALSGFYLKL